MSVNLHSDELRVPVDRISAPVDEPAPGLIKLIETESNKQGKSDGMIENINGSD